MTLVLFTIFHPLNPHRVVGLQIRPFLFSGLDFNYLKPLFKKNWAEQYLFDTDTVIQAEGVEIQPAKQKEAMYKVIHK